MNEISQYSIDYSKGKSPSILNTYFILLFHRQNMNIQKLSFCSWIKRMDLIF